MRNLRGIIFLVGSAIIVIAIVIGLVQGSVESDTMYRALLNHTPIKIIELNITRGATNSGTRQITLENDTICKEIAATFRYLSEFTPERTRDHTVFIKMSIFKGRKLDLALLKTTYSGWAINLVDKWYKDDSLIFALNKFANIDQ